MMPFAFVFAMILRLLCATALAIFVDSIFAILVRSLSDKPLGSWAQLLSIRSIEAIVLIILLWPIFQHALTPPLGRHLKNIVIGLGISLIGALSAFALNAILKAIWGVDLLQQLTVPSPFVINPALVLSAVIVGPFVEELFFRVYLWHSIADFPRKMLYLGAGLQVLLFASLHLSPDHPLSDQWMMLIVWSTCGVTTLGLYLWRKSILPGWILHGAANAVLFFGS